MVSIKITKLALLCAVITLVGCSSTPLVPTEDRNNVPSQTQQSKPVIVIDKDNAIAMPLPDELPLITPPSQHYIESTQVSPKPERVPVSPTKIAPVSQNTAVIALLNEANNYSQQGNVRSAQSSLQRAQRIAPRDPEVYFALAKTHLDLQDYALAEQVALKGISIVQGQPNQLHRFWTLIAQIRTATGNISGAKQAQQTANRY